MQYLINIIIPYLSYRPDSYRPLLPPTHSFLRSCLLRRHCSYSCLVCSLDAPALSFAEDSMSHHHTLLNLWLLQSFLPFSFPYVHCTSEDVKQMFCLGLSLGTLIHSLCLASCWFLYWPLPSAEKKKKWNKNKNKASLAKTDSHTTSPPLESAAVCFLLGIWSPGLGDRAS